MRKYVLNKNIYKLIFVYIISIIVYGVWVSRFSIPVHLRVDEELYISVARSFFYEGVFSQQGNMLDYTCVLYPMLLSLAYFFYSPERIMFGLRIVGVVTMLSSIFPIFFIGKILLKDKEKAFREACFSCLERKFAELCYKND